MNRQQAIISLLQQEIATAITTGNGYNNTVAKVIRKNKNLTEITEFPTVWFQVENETREFINLALQENNKQVTFEYPDYIPEIRKKLNLIMAVAICSEIDINDEGLLSEQAALIQEDIDDYFHKNRPVSCSLDTIDWVQYWIVQKTEPILDDKLHKGNIAFRIYIEYIDNEEKIDGELPTVPVITSPSNGSTVTSGQPDIEWTTDPSGLSNHLQISTDSGFSALLVNQTFLNTTSYTISSEDSLENGTYFLRVRTYNNFGYSDWSNSVSFIVDAEQALTPIHWNQVSGANSWWNAYSATANTIVSGSISASLDQIGSRNLIQTTSTRRPSLSGNAWGSLSSIYFNPTFASESDVLGYNDTTGAFKWDNSTSGSVMLVMLSDGTNFDVNSGYFCPIARTNTNYGAQFSLLRGVNSGPGGYQFGYPFPTGNYFVIPTALNVPHQIIMTHSGSASTFYYDGVCLGSLNKSLLTFTVEGNSFFNIGGFYNDAANHGSGKYTGHIFEAGFSTSAISSANVKALYEGFKNRFNL